MTMLADFITVDGVEWRRKTSYPPAYTNGGSYEVYRHSVGVNQYVWRSRRRVGHGHDAWWQELDMYGSHGDPATAIKFVQLTQGIEKLT